MIKKFCDKCDKEIEDDNYVQQTVMAHYNYEWTEGIFCKNCWEDEDIEEKVILSKEEDYEFIDYLVDKYKIPVGKGYKNFIEIAINEYKLNSNQIKNSNVERNNKVV